MIRHKGILQTRNKLAELAMWCDSAAAIQGSKLSTAEREELQKLIRKAVGYIDKKLPKP